jgi:hypothetical protein
LAIAGFRDRFGHVDKPILLLDGLGVWMEKRDFAHVQKTGGGQAMLDIKKSADL